MNLFYSGTDTDTLLENAGDFDMFLSVIVNHKDHPIAKISQSGTVESIEKYTYKFKGGFITKEPVTTTKEVIYIYDCNVVIDTSIIDNELKVVDAIVKERKSKFVPQTTTTSFRSPLDFDWDLPYKGKTFNGKQISLFEEPIEPLDNMSIKDKTIELLKRCLLGIDAEEYTLQQAREEYLAEKKAIGGTLKELKKNVEDSLDEDLDDLFGVEICNPVIAKEVLTHLSIITNESSDEKMIKTLIENKLK